MKKIILGFALFLTIASSQELTYADLYGEVQMNTVIANKCLEEIAYQRKINGETCKLYWDLVGKNPSVYQRLLQRNFSDFDTKGTFWTNDDWIILKNKMKKLIYLSELIKQTS